MSGIEVQLIDQGPATFEVLVATWDGEEFSLLTQFRNRAERERGWGSARPDSHL